MLGKIYVMVLWMLCMQYLTMLGGFPLSLPVRVYREFITLNLAYLKPRCLAVHHLSLIHI